MISNRMCPEAFWDAGKQHSMLQQLQALPPVLHQAALYSARVPDTSFVSCKWQKEAAGQVRRMKTMLPARVASSTVRKTCTSSHA